MNLGNVATRHKFPPRYQRDGRLVAFVSSATNLIPNDVVDDDPHVYVRDLTTGTTELASVGSDGIRANVGFFDSPATSSGGALSPSLPSTISSQRIHARFHSTSTCVTARREPPNSSA